MARLRVVLLSIVLSALSPLLEGCFAQANSPDFDSARAFDLLRKQCDFGPRPPGTPAHEKCRDYLLSELSTYASSAELQSFEHVRSGKTYKFANVIGKFGKSGTPAILLCAHWDTRPTADQELEPADQKKPILGANDGASGVAVLLELARMFHERPPAVPVTIVLFDGEDFGPKEGDMFLGAKHFASTLKKPTGYRYGILLDMIGDKGLGIYKEWNSVSAAGDVVDRIWSAARSLGHGSAFIDQTKYTISDDHVPLIRAGLPCVDVIDFDYAYWHTLSDTVDKCSPKSLQTVGETIAKVVYSEKLD
jgi:glutaminyl-peptide cyclotransferase